MQLIKETVWGPEVMVEMGRGRVNTSLTLTFLLGTGSRRVAVGVCPVFSDLGGIASKGVVQGEANVTVLRISSMASAVVEAAAEIGVEGGLLATPARAEAAAMASSPGIAFLSPGPIVISGKAAPVQID